MPKSKNQTNKKAIPLVWELEPAKTLDGLLIRLKSSNLPTKNDRLPEHIKVLIDFLEDFEANTLPTQNGGRSINARRIDYLNDKVKTLLQLLAGKVSRENKKDANQWDIILLTFYNVLFALFPNQLVKKAVSNLSSSSSRVNYTNPFKTEQIFSAKAIAHLKKTKIMLLQIKDAFGKPLFPFDKTLIRKGVYIVYPARPFRYGYKFYSLYGKLPDFHTQPPLSNENLSLIRSFIGGDFQTLTDEQIDYLFYMGWGLITLKTHFIQKCYVPNDRLYNLFWDDILAHIRQYLDTNSKEKRLFELIKSKSDTKTNEASGKAGDKIIKLTDFIRDNCEDTTSISSKVNRIHEFVKNRQINFMPQPINKTKGNETKLYKEKELREIWPKLKEKIKSLPNLKA
jgi:hypothetical protein